MKTISSKLAKAKKEDPNLNGREFLDQLKKENPTVSNKAFAFVAAREKCSYEQRRKTQLSKVINAIEKASKALSKDVNEVECSVI